MNVLVINPGSTSTKLGLFTHISCEWKSNISHSKTGNQICSSFQEEIDSRKKLILTELQRHNTKLTSLNAVVSRGGLLAPLESGTYTINKTMLADLFSCKYGKHASNLGAIIAAELAAVAEIPSFIVDPPAVDELEPVARISGLPEIQRRSLFHALNQKSAARACALKLGIKYEDNSFIVAHMGGGISVGAHRNGRVIDVSNALDGEGPMSPERSGALPVHKIVSSIAQGTATPEQFMKKITQTGGMYAYLGTNNMTEAMNRADNGDAHARLVIEAMAYQTAKEIGAMAAVLRGNISAIVLTGGLAENSSFTKMIIEQTQFLAEIMIIPQAEEEALAAGALNVLQGKEQAREYCSG